VCRLLAIVKRIADAGAQFRSLAEPWTPTATSTGRLMLAALGGLADLQRDLVRTRTAEGRSRAKAKEYTWADRPSSEPRCSRQRPASGARTVLRSTSSPAATTWGKHHSPCDEGRMSALTLRLAKWEGCKDGIG
jgi:hypothetical protein